MCVGELHALMRYAHEQEERKENDFGPRRSGHYKRRVAADYGDQNLDRRRDAI